MSTSRRRSNLVLEETSLAQAALVAAALVVVFSSTVVVIGLTPSMAVPVGVSGTSGTSMAPTYGTSGIALYADVGELDPGDLVVFYDSSTENYVQHRVVERTSRGLVTQGDNVGATDQNLGAEYVTSENLVGEVYFVFDEKGVHLPGF